ncbi:MAG: SDR family oxidoreductase [Anaerolineae bacterium]|nr:MAG: SDR family oxidoreductase [Anaerolineae bacterium]
MTVSLVTGGAGFIGSHIVEALLRRGDRVRVLDNFSTGRRENLAAVAGDVEILEGDLRDREAVRRAVQGAELIFHQAAFVSVPLSVADPETCFAVNVRGTFNLLEAARQAGARRVVLASSAAVYGEAEVFPLTEDLPTASLSPYAASKRTNEIYADLYTRLTPMGVTALRYFNVFGPRQSPESDYAAAIPIFIRRMLRGEAPVIYGDGHQSRDFIFVGDVARANLMAADAPAAAGGIFNICSGEEISILDLVATLGRVLPDAPPPRFDAPRPGDIYRSIGSGQRAAEVFGFRPQVSLEEGLRQTVEWMRL